MKKIFLLLAAVALLVPSCRFVRYSGEGGASARRVRCGGPVETRDIAGIGPFETLVVNGAADIEFVQGDSCGVTVRANAEVFDYLHFRVEENGTLVLESRDKVQITADEYDIRVTAPLLRSVVINGAADFDLEGPYRSPEDFSLLVNGAGDFDLAGLTVPKFSAVINGAGELSAGKLDVAQLVVNINGAGEAQLSGKAGKAELAVSGAGSIDARRLDCRDIVSRKAGIASIKLPE